jgi:next-to-BRCA1 protein 1
MQLRSVLQVQPEDEVVFERYSDSAGAYVTLAPDSPQVYKTLFRAAKAKLKLRLRATLVGEDPEAPRFGAPIPGPIWDDILPPNYRMSTDTLSPAGAAHVSPPSNHMPMPPAPVPEVAQVSPISPLASIKATTEDEAPLPPTFSARPSRSEAVLTAFPAYHHSGFFKNLAAASHNADLAFRPKENPQTSWVVFCNNCNQAMEDAHYHCSICDNGDYDLCPSCVDDGIHCPGTGHWLVKRFVKQGAVVNSTTERIGPKIQLKAENEMPGAFTDEKQPVIEEAEEPTRTCNCCVKSEYPRCACNDPSLTCTVLPETDFVTCTKCDDYDLCLECHVSNKHGHHPGHTFKAATPGTVLPTLANFLCNSGRNVRHSAVCDGCDKVRRDYTFLRCMLTRSSSYMVCATSA